MNITKGSWKTTLTGILTIVGAVIGVSVAALNDKPIDIPTTIAAITAGIGLLAARDNDKSSEDVGAKSNDSKPTP